MLKSVFLAFALFAGTAMAVDVSTLPKLLKPVRLPRVTPNGDIQLVCGSSSWFCEPRSTTGGTFHEGMSKLVAEIPRLYMCDGEKQPFGDCTIEGRRRYFAPAGLGRKGAMYYKSLNLDLFNSKNDTMIWCHRC